MWVFVVLYNTPLHPWISPCTTVTVWKHSRLELLLRCTSWGPFLVTVWLQKCMCVYVCYQQMVVWVSKCVCVWLLMRHSVYCMRHCCVHTNGRGCPPPECRAHPERLIAIHVNESPWIKLQPKAYLHRVKMHVVLEEKSSRDSPWMKSVSLHHAA